jgi:signal transduction histidine kinase
MQTEMNKLKMLLIEDNEFDRLSINRAFSRSGLPYSIEECERAEDAYDLLKKNTDIYNIVVIDYRLPGISGLDLLKDILGKKLPMPVVILTGSGSEQVAVDALKIGAYDYIVKDPYGGYLELLPFVLNDVVQKYNDRIARERAEEMIKQRDAELQVKNEQLEKLNALNSEMVAITSHDLRVPLNAIVGYAEMLKTKLSSLNDREAESWTDRIIENGYRMAAFTRDLLDLKRIDDYKFHVVMKPVHLDAILNECIEMNSIAMKNRNLKITSNKEGESRMIRVDPLKMEQVFNNILSNAIKFSPEGGVISVQYRDSSANSISVIICDEGPGIPEESLEVIFDRYYQAEMKDKSSKRGYGMGFGLYISREIMNLHMGRIWAVNKPERGCCFHIEIPTGN